MSKECAFSVKRRFRTPLVKVVVFSDIQKNGFIEAVLFLAIDCLLSGLFSVFSFDCEPY